MMRAMLSCLHFIESAIGRRLPLIRQSIQRDPLIDSTVSEKNTLRLVRLPVKELIMLETVTVNKLPFRKAVNGCNSYSMLYHDVNAANMSLAILLAWVLSATCALILEKNGFISSLVCKRCCFLYQYVYYVRKRKKRVLKCMYVNFLSVI